MVTSQQQSVCSDDIPRARIVDIGYKNDSMDQVMMGAQGVKTFDTLCSHHDLVINGVPCRLNS